MNSSAPTYHEIASHAYGIYVRNGYENGRALDHWLEAERDLRERSTSSPAQAKPARPAATAPAPAKKPAAPTAAKARPAKGNSKSAK